jgi:hypothetical protein
LFNAYDEADFAMVDKQMSDSGGDSDSDTVRVNITDNGIQNVSFNGDRTQLTITLVDGGTGDDGGQQNGIIEDPSGLGAAPAVSSSSGGGGTGGCFIDTLSTGFTWFQF